MKRLVWVWVVLLFACSNNSTGSTTFRPEDLVVPGNPTILGEDSGTADNPSGFVETSGVIDSQSGLALTGLKVQVRVLGGSGEALATRLEACVPDSISPKGSTTFHVTVSVVGVSYTSSRQVEITPISDQGTGTVRTISVSW